jgi:glycosyltransferase involved in cell wall biosynthesis
MDITVTITTVNRADRLAKSLEALVGQDFSRSSFEVIVADNGSTDHTKEICDGFAARIENFTYFFDARPGQIVGWHQAPAEAKGEITCFIDDDVCPDPSWLSGIYDAYKTPEVGLVTGPIKLSYETSPPDWVDHMVLGEPGGQTLPLFGMLDCGSEIREIPGNFVWGTNFTVRKSCLLEVHGFHPCAMPARLLEFYGDGEIHVGRSVEALGYNVLYHPAASVVHHIPEDRLTVKSVKTKFMTTGFARSFQTLRQMGGPYELPGEEELRQMVLRYFRNPEQAPADLIQTVQDGLTEGISRHLIKFIDDSAFRDWVMQDNYLDLDKCYVHPELLEKNSNEADWRAGK